MSVGQFFMQYTYFIKTWKYDRDSIYYLHNKKNIKKSQSNGQCRREKCTLNKPVMPSEAFVEEFILLKICKTQLDCHICETPLKLLSMR